MMIIIFFLYLKIGEVLKNKLNLEWAIKKEYGPYNAYFIPILVDKNRSKFMQNTISSIADDIHFMNKPINKIIEFELNPAVNQFNKLDLHKEIAPGIFYYDWQSMDLGKNSTLGGAIWGH